ncbi:hypothetical protein AVEN_221947-1 [Araneus ventricosus]|uniref:Uncharacterized protein n=1 Tax=Araneus ventricosus TaxID=182803 RepID=A0A4Y2F719_ARAVE|nr:hypothetical protein AVEN_221947-1 [Araneus ventricosus]
MLNFERVYIRELAARLIIKSRVSSSNVKSERERTCLSPLNFKAADYTEMIDWSSITITSPLILRNISTALFRSIVRDKKNSEWDFVHFPYDTQAVELCVNLVTETSIKYALTNDIWTYQWSAKLNDNNIEFQAEFTAFHEAEIYSSHLPNHNVSKIHLDNTASIMASSYSKSTKETARKNFKIILTNPRIKVSWVKEHEGNIGNERVYQLAKDATQLGKPYSLTKLPKPPIKGLLRKSVLEEWHTLWKNGDRGRKIYNSMPSVSLRPTN